MRWTSGKAKARRRMKALSEWHDWFAWRPVTTTSGETVWLERVKRLYTNLQRGGRFEVFLDTYFDDYVQYQTLDTHLKEAITVQEGRRE